MNQAPETLAHRLAAADPEVRREWEVLTARQAHLPPRLKVGVHYGGLSTVFSRPKTPDELLDEAERAITKHRAWEASPDGRFYSHLTAIDTYAQGIIHTLEAVKAARSRGFEGEHNRSAAVARLEEIASAAERAKVAARLAIDFAAGMATPALQAAE